MQTIGITRIPHAPTGGMATGGCPVGRAFAAAAAKEFDCLHFGSSDLL